MGEILYALLTLIYDVINYGHGTLNESMLLTIKPKRLPFLEYTVSESVDELPVLFFK